MQAKLCEYLPLEKSFEAHMKEGLYLLQFRKCMDNNYCKLIAEPLPPPIPAPVLAPDGLHCLPFDDLYGKVTTTEEFCPSLKSKKAEKSKEPGYKISVVMLLLN